MTFNDDEEIIAAQDSQGGAEPEATQGDRIKLSVRNNMGTAPLEETNMEVLLELTGLSTLSDGVDIVAVLDVSLIMRGKKFNKMKLAVQFLVDKLNATDRLSIVTFGRSSQRLCPLRCMTENARVEISNLVNQLDANSRLTSITAGLKTALRLLHERCHTSTVRRTAVLLFSSGYQSPGTGDPTNVQVGHIPIFTLGFGMDYDMSVLEAIARRSKRGTFTNIDVQNTASRNLSIAFSPCLERILPVVAPQLMLIIKKTETNVKKVTVKEYPQSQDNDGSINISLGNLFIKDTRKVTVELLLPVVGASKATDVLEIVYNYLLDGSVESRFTSPPLMVLVTRTSSSSEANQQDLDAARSRTAFSHHKWPLPRNKWPRRHHIRSPLNMLQFAARLK